jgi:hypothetical protein
MSNHKASSAQYRVLWAPVVDSVISLTIETSVSLSFPLESLIGWAGASDILAYGLKLAHYPAFRQIAFNKRTPPSFLGSFVVPISFEFRLPAMLPLSGLRI